MKCHEEGCGGEVNTGMVIYLKVSCGCSFPAQPCTTCGRVHWPNGTRVYTESGNKVFFESGEIVHRDENNQRIA